MYSPSPSVSSSQRNNRAERTNYFTQRQYTFLEITPADTSSNLSTETLSQYSKRYLLPSQLSKAFAECFDFETPSQEEIIAYFIDNIYCVEFSPIQIRSGIKRLKNIIKYGAPISAPSTPTTISSSIPEPIKFNQHVRSLNIKQPDGTFKAQLIEDFNITNRTPLKNIKPLSSNSHQQNG